MQFLSGLAQFLPRPPSNTTPDHRSKPGATTDPIASDGDKQEEEDLGGDSGTKTAGGSANVRRGNTTFPSRGYFPRPFGGLNMRREDETSDEHRLFPSFKKSQDDVPISIGQSFTKSKRSKVNQLSAFRPVDRITPKAKDSGPIRASGGIYATNGSVHKPTASRHPFSSPTLVDNEHRVLKRRRHSSGQVIDLVGDDESHAVDDRSTHQDWQPRRDRSPSVASVVSPKHQGNKSNQTRVSKHQDEDEDEDESQVVCVEVKSTKSKDGPKKPTETVELDRSDEEESAQSLEDENQVEERTRRDSDASESPDELQNDASFRTNPESFASNRQNIGSHSFLHELDRKPQKGVKRRLSPSDIRPTVFNSSNKTTDRRQPQNQRHSRSHKHLFDVKYFRFDNIQLENRQLVLDEGADTIGLHQSIPVVSIPLRRIRQVLRGTAGSLKCRFNLSKIEGTVNQALIDIEFATAAEKDQFCGLLPKTARICERPGEWMDKAFDNVVSVEPIRGKRNSSPVIAETGEKPKTEPVKRQRLSATLQGEDEPPSGISHPPRRVPLPITQFTSSAPKKPRSKDNEAVPIPVKKYQGPRGERETRSNARRGLVDLIDDETVSSPKGNPGDLWSKPLVYPPIGKKKAEVNGYDLERLQDGEFLNDNLIGFYARFLEHYLERNKAEVSKRVYFFNSYFYATLTSPSKGKKGVNYQGVSKWTRNVDLFSHDYVVVPINESAHWYLAVICNLTTLKKRSEVEEMKSSSDEDVEPQHKVQDHEIPETPPLEKAATPEEIARDSLASMKIDDFVPSSNPQNGTNSENEWPEQEENQMSPPAIFQGDIPTETVRTKSAAARKKKKLKFPGAAYSIDQPTIITFDSLDAPRQSAIKILKQYLMEESRKSDLSFDMKDIKGMTAKGIPLQPNYSDCGLYLLAYLEKFVQDPDGFVRSVLRREMKTQVDWPSLKSGLLRRRLRDFLSKLHEEQISGKETDLLVDAQPISYLLSPAARPVKQAQDVEAAPPAESDSEKEIIVDSFQDKEGANNEAESDVESVVQETQFSEQQGIPGPGIEKDKTKDESKAEQDDEAVIEVPKTPEREPDNNARVPDDSCIVIADSAPDEQKQTPRREHRVQTERNIFDDMYEYLSTMPPLDRVEVQVPIVQVPDTPPAGKKTRKERTSPRLVKKKM